MTDNIMTQTLYSPDGTQHFTALEADPHFGAQSVYSAILETRTPGGRTHSVYPMRAKQVDDIKNALSLSEWTDIVEVNERFYESTYNRQARTLTTKTPEGRVTITHFDEAGRPVSRQNPGVAEQRWRYNDLGQTVMGQAFKMTFYSRCLRFTLQVAGSV